MKIIPIFLFLFFQSVQAGGLNYPPTVLLEEDTPKKVYETPAPVQIVIQEECGNKVVYYSTPGVTAGISRLGGALSTIVGGAVAANSMSFVGGGAIFGTTGQTWPVVETCWVGNIGERND